MKLTAVCISKTQITFPLKIDFLCDTTGFREFPHYPRVKTIERIEYLASRRNHAVRTAIDKYPETSHLFMVDTYYFDQVKEMKSLIDEYEYSLRMGGNQKNNVILGASTWFKNPARIPVHYEFWDSWTNPEFNGLQEKKVPYEWYWRQTTGAGGFTIFPRWVWEKQGYGVPYPFPESGCETNYLSRCPGVETFLSFRTRTWRDPPEELMNKPWINRLRTTLGIGTKARWLIRK